MNDRCAATKADGSQCRANALPGKALCWAHDETLRPKAAAARRRGGQNKSIAARAQKRMPREVREIVAIVEAAMGGVLQVKISPSQAHAVASLAGAWVRLHEIGELTQRLEELERRTEGQPQLQSHTYGPRRQG